MFPSNALTVAVMGREPVPSSALGRDRWPAAVSFAGMLAVILFAPFEAMQPWLRLPGQAVSSVEVLLLLVFVAWAGSLLLTRSTPDVRTPLTAPGVSLLAASLCAAVLAPAHPANALHMVGRLALTMGLALLTVNAVRAPRAGLSAVVAIGLAGAAVSILVALDYSGAPLGQHLLAPFRAQTAYVGAQVRASGPFQYPTIASMFLEITFAFGLGLLPLLVERGRRSASALLLAGLLLMAAAVMLTFTRAGLITMAASLTLVVGWRWRRNGFDRAVVVLLGLALAIAALLPVLRSTDALRLRTTSEQQNGWYRARVVAPPHLSLAAGARRAVPVTVTNTGQVTWDSHATPPFGFSYHWLTADGSRVVSWEGIRALFPTPVAPGDEVTLEALVEAPRQAGDYRLVWDLYQDQLLWFSTEPDAEMATSEATVTGEGTGPPIDTLSLPRAPAPATRPGRRLLWTAALRMLAVRPWLGVGPDNFRLMYGPYAGLPRADPRVHTNNLYLELLVGGGLLTGLASLWFGWRLVRLAVAAYRGSESPVTLALASGAVAATAAIGVHGLVDAFLSFTATYAVIGIAIGLLVASSRLSLRHAHRV